MGTYGNITFGTDQSAFYDPSRDRFLLFRTFAGAMTNTVPLIAPFFRKLGGFDPDDVNRRYVKQLADRIVITWVMSEPYREVFAFTSDALMNRFQVVLYANGIIELSYDQVTALDAIVGVFPVDSAAGASWTLSDAVDPTLPGYIDVTSVTAAVIGPSTLRFTFYVRDQVLPIGDPANDDLWYRIFVDTDKPFVTGVDYSDFDATFGVYGDAPDFQYLPYYAPSVDSASITVSANSIAFDVSTSVLNGATRVAFFVDAVDFNAPAPNHDPAGAVLVQLPPVIGVAGDPTEPALPAHLDVQSVVASLVGNHSLRFSFNLRGAALLAGDPGLSQLLYRVFVDLEAPFVNGIDFADSDEDWYAFGSGDLQYHTSGPGVASNIDIDGNILSFIIPITGLGGASTFAFFVDAVDFATGQFDQVNAVVVTLPPLPSPTVDLSVTSPATPPRELVYEAFHYFDVPHERELTPIIIDALGDRFDFFAFYTDFRIDRQETGAGGFGAIGNLVSGVVFSSRTAADWGSAGQLQSGQMASYVHTPLAAPSGADLSGPYVDYARAVTLLAHELGHRWLTLQQANVGGNIVAIGDSAPHWLFGLHAPVAFPVGLPLGASAMAGSFWQDNANGTFTHLTQPFFVGVGYSYLDLYLMGFLPAAGVPPFFLVQNPAFVNYDGQGHPIYSGTRLDVTLSDVTAVSGPRMPPFDTSQKSFNLGLVGVVPSGAAASATLQERLSGIRTAFAGFFAAATGGVGQMRSIAFGDGNSDGDVDLSDVGAIQRCFSGTSLNPAPACSPFDFGQDQVIGPPDYAAFQSVMTGP